MQCKRNSFYFSIFLPYSHQASLSLILSLSLLDLLSISIYVSLHIFITSLFPTISLSLSVYVSQSLFIAFSLCLSLSLPLPLYLSTYISRKNMYLYYVILTVFYYSLSFYLSVIISSFSHFSQYNLSFSSYSLSLWSQMFRKKSFIGSISIVTMFKDEDEP